ncbi:hypothetical protein WJX73_002151 [Symbiochloris irregularis]|uniref:FAS1 domain-containing protein n=1 Tax=Symbiochloris irregularis TaxID=706552 RepID=A0AAW1PYC0_9CHLO
MEEPPDAGDAAEKAEEGLPAVHESRELSAVPPLTSPASIAAEQEQSASETPFHTPSRQERGWTWRFNNPKQVKPRHYMIVRILGRVGWNAKGLVYALIGGLSCQSAVGDGDENSASPQGAFILVGSNTIGVPLLVVMAIALICYCMWRFWEAITGQGADASFGNLKNFFRYRLSPFVSGCVYGLYTVFVISLIPKSKEDRQNQTNSGFPDSWTHNAAGKTGLSLAGIAFVAAFLVQMEGTFTRNFHETLRPGMPGWLKWITWITGHLGFFARGGVFLCVAVLFFRAIRDPSASSHKTAIADALYQLKTNSGGKALLFILGFGLLVYSLFAVLNGMYVREFPTRVPSGVPHGQKTPMARAVSVVMSKASFSRRRRSNSMSGGFPDGGAAGPQRAGSLTSSGDLPNGHALGNGHAHENVLTGENGHGKDSPKDIEMAAQDLPANGSTDGDCCLRYLQYSAREHGVTWESARHTRNTIQLERARDRIAALLLLLCLSTFNPVLVRCQANEGSEGSEGTSEASERNQGSEGSEGSSSDGADEGEGTDVGANPPGSLIGCNSPYTYLEANSRGDLFTFHALVESDPDVKQAFKYRNTTGTLFIPTDQAFTLLTNRTGLNVLTPGAVTTSLLQALLEYHFIFEVLDPATLAASSGNTAYDTALVLDATGVNAKVGVPEWELFTQSSGLSYQSINVTAANLPSGQGGQNAPADSYNVTGNASSANIIWNGSTQPVRTCAGVIYLIDNVLLPSSSISALNAGGTATAPIAAAGESEGASLGDADAPLPAGISTAGRKLK